MSQLITDCPRCRAQRTTFDVIANVMIEVSHGWRHHFETFAVCRHCNRSTIFVLGQREATLDGGEPQFPIDCRSSVNAFFDVDGYISLKDASGANPPDHVPKQIAAAFEEGAKCVAIRCNNAAAGMFRLCVDHATKSLLPADDPDGLTKFIRGNLSQRLKWLFDTKRLPEGLKDLSTCIREDGNDGVHAGSLGEADAIDLQDFAYELLERMYTEPERLRLAKERRDQRRTASKPTP